MAIGDGVRRNIAKISQAERDKFREAIRQLDMSKLFPDGVSYWDKQDQIHQSTHVHGGPAFLPWHRELCNRFEALLREVDPQLSLHYWDWTTDPRASNNGNGGVTNLFSNTLMGSAAGRAGVPLETFDNNGALAGSRDQTGNPADPPRTITRNVAAGAPAISSDATIVTTGNGLSNDQQYPALRGAVEGAHNSVHGFIGGTIGNGHSAFEDPFVFLLHSNVDRLLAMWQTAAGRTWRLDPGQVYGSESNTNDEDGIVTPLEPWAGGTGTRPWAPPDNQQVSKNSRHRTVVAPTRYDTVELLQRKGDSANLAGFVSEIAAVKHSQQQVVTAVRTQANTLKLISWRVNNDGSVARTGDSANLAGIASEIDIAKGGRFVTACRTAANNLKLISWDVNNAGAITRAGDSGNQAGEASEVKIVAISNTLFVTACRTASGTLKLISWRLNNDGSLTRLSDSANAAGAVSEVSLLLRNSNQVVTSVRDGNGKLKLIVWNVAASGAITRLGDSAALAGAATLIRSAKDSHGHVITSVRAADGTLKLIVWSISANGNTVTRLGDSSNQAGQIGDNALMTRPGGLMVSAVRTAAGTLKLISWCINAAGAIVRSIDSANQAGTASLITFCPDSLSGSAPIVTAVRTANNNLRLITWGG